MIKLIFSMTEAYKTSSLLFPEVRFTVILIVVVDMPENYEGDDLSKIKNNTIIGDAYDENQEDMLRAMLNK